MRKSPGRGKNNDGGPDGAQSIRRAVAILRVVAVGREAGVTLPEIVEASRLKRPTVHRIVQALAREGLIEPRGQAKRFAIGRQINELALARRVRTPLEVCADPHIRKLAHDLGDTTFLTARTGIHSLCIARHLGSFPIQVLAVEVGARRPLTVGSSGIAMLSTLDPAEVLEIVHQLAGRYGRFKVPTSTTLKQVAIARSKGYCLMEVGLVPGTKAIGVPIPLGSTAEAAITLAAVRRRLSPSREPEIVEKLQAAASAIALHLKKSTDALRK